MEPLGISSQTLYSQNLKSLGYIVVAADSTLHLHSNFVVGSERRTRFETQCVMALQGYPRSLISTSIESVYAISYWSSIVTLVDPILPRFRDTAGFLLTNTPPLFHLNFRGVPLGLESRLPRLCLRGAKTLS